MGAAVGRLPDAAGSGAGKVDAGVAGLADDGDDAVADRADVAVGELVEEVFVAGLGGVLRRLSGDQGRCKQHKRNQKAGAELTNGERSLHRILL